MEIVTMVQTEMQTTIVSICQHSVVQLDRL